MRQINLLVIHCSATKENQPFTLQVLEASHRKRGFNGIGYHYYIRQSGEVINTRPLNRIGAHSKGYNRYSIGICYEGGLDSEGNPADTRTPEQKEALLKLLKRLKKDYPDAQILGHRDLPNVVKECPCFEVKAEYINLSSGG